MMNVAGHVNAVALFWPFRARRRPSVALHYATAHIVSGCGKAGLRKQPWLFAFINRIYKEFYFIRFWRFTATVYKQSCYKLSR